MNRTRLTLVTNLVNSIKTAGCGIEITTSKMLRRIGHIYLVGTFCLCTLGFTGNAYGDTGPQLETKINAYGTGGGTGGALLAVWDAGTQTVTVTNTSGQPITNAANKLALNIDTNVTVLWKAELTTVSGTVTLTDGYVTVSGKGTFEVAAGGKIEKLSSGSMYSISTLVATDNTTIKVTGGLVASNAGSNNIAISLNLNAKLIVSGGTIRGTNSYGIECNDNNSIIISDAAFITSNHDATIFTRGNAPIIMTGGRVENTRSITTSESHTIAIGSGGIQIYGGTVSSINGNCIYTRSSTGTIVISDTNSSQPTLITSANSNNNSYGGTIRLHHGSTSTSTRLTINGGRIENTANNTNAKVIHNLTRNGIMILGGTISAANGIVIDNDSTGAINVSNATLSATAGTVIYNRAAGAVDISNSTITVTTSGDCIRNNSTGTVNVSNSTISVTGTGNGILNQSTGVVTMSSGLISVASGIGIRNATGAINVSGGTVNVADGNAIYNNGYGTINISETDPVNNPTLITSSYTTLPGGTISLQSGATVNVLTISGGIVENTVDNVNARAIYNAGTNGVTISGGMVRAATGYAYYGAGASILTVNGTGVVFAHGSGMSNVIFHNTFSTPSGDGLVIAWNKTAGKTQYILEDNEDLISVPALFATWDLQQGKKGIAYSKGANIGFMEIQGIDILTLPVITTTALANGNVGTAYNETLTATGSQPITWSLDNSLPLPAGLVLSASLGEILGTPTANGTFPIIVNATNGAGTVSKSLSITIDKGIGAAVSTPVLNNKTDVSISIQAVAALANGQSVEYGINTTNAAPSAWQSGTVFSGLTKNTTYYIFARSADNAAYHAGTPSASLEVTTNNEVSINELSVVNSHISVYPNPTTGQLVIENGELKIENVEIYDVLGRKQNAESRKGENTVTMDISGLASGIYFLKIDNVVVKVIKN